MQSPIPPSLRSNGDAPDIDSISVISVDVFDTVLIRKPISEVRRRSRVAALIKKKLRSLEIGEDITAELLRSTRVQIESLAFRARELFGYSGEVRLTEIIGKQLTLLNLPRRTATVFLDAEIEIEKRCLKPNTELLSWLRDLQNDGKKIVAISDTILPLPALEVLLEELTQGFRFIKVYSSADAHETKKEGGLFSAVANDLKVSAHEIWHMGDDLHADVRKAWSAGLDASHLPRPKLSQYLRKSDGALHLLERSIRIPRQRGERLASDDRPSAVFQEEFGRTVLGPILLESSLKLWLYLSEIDSDSSAKALFCARGGLLVRATYETVCERLSLETPIENCDFMVSRLVASRLALVRDHQFASREISREFSESTIAQAIRAVGGGAVEVGGKWDIPATPDGLLAFFESPDATEFFAALEEQNKLFEKHIHDTVGPNPGRLILVDTGLFGSTLRFMIDGNPERSWESVMLARSDYKGTGSEHFSKATGLWTEANNYHFWNPRTSVLRFWQLVEHTFEPQLESVSSFKLVGRDVKSNLEREDWRESLETSNSPIFMGAMAYLESLSPDNLVDRLKQIDPSWRRLKQVIVFPNAAEEKLFSVDNRSIDFGRKKYLRDTDRPFSKSYAKKLRHIRLSIWRPGAILRQFPRLGRPLTYALEAMYMVKGAVSWRPKGRR